MKQYRVVIYGIGECYNKNYNIIKYFQYVGQFEVLGVTAKWVPDSLTLDGFKIIRLDKLNTVPYDYVIVMSDIYFNEIVRDLMGIGIEREKIITYRVLQIPDLDFVQYVELKNSNVSIISNNCWGGIICYTMGIECKSPFKNLSLEDQDYLRVLRNLKYYMGLKLKFLEFAYNKNSHKNYPVMALDDVKVHCNHDTIPQEAAEKWERRKTKINYDNLFIEMYTESEETMNAFLKLEGYEKRICFVPFRTGVKDTYQLLRYPGQDYFWQAVNSNAGNGSNSIIYNSLKLMMGMIPDRLHGWVADTDG